MKNTQNETLRDAKEFWTGLLDQDNWPTHIPLLADDLLCAFEGIYATPTSEKMLAIYRIMHVIEMISGKDAFVANEFAAQLKGEILKRTPTFTTLQRAVDKNVLEDIDWFNPSDPDASAATRLVVRRVLV